MLPEQALPRPSSGSSNISCRRGKTGQVLGDPRSDQHSASTHSDAVPPWKLARPGVREQVRRASVFMNLSSHKILLRDCSVNVSS
jgi:hypothetical protein